MNKELLIKLIKLANHNNADGEANAAARRVCKMIENDQFKCLGQEIKTKPVDSPFTYTTQPASNPPKSAYDYVKEKFYYKDDPFSDFRHYKVNVDWGEEPFKTPYKQAYNREDEAYYRRRSKRGFGDEKRNLKCKTCGNVRETIFTGLENLFECNDCQWTAYERKKK